MVSFEGYWRRVAPSQPLKRLLGLTCIVPMYLAEASPTNLRGMLGSLHQLLVTIAILASQVCTVHPLPIRNFKLCLPRRERVLSRPPFHVGHIIY